MPDECVPQTQRLQTYSSRTDGQKISHRLWLVPGWFPTSIASGRRNEQMPPTSGAARFLWLGGRPIFTGISQFILVSAVVSRRPIPQETCIILVYAPAWPSLRGPDPEPSGDVPDAVTYSNETLLDNFGTGCQTRRFYSICWWSMVGSVLYGAQFAEMMLLLSTVRSRVRPIFTTAQLQQQRLAVSHWLSCSNLFTGDSTYPIIILPFIFSAFLFCHANKRTHAHTKILTPKRTALTAAAVWAYKLFVQDS